MTIDNRPYSDGDHSMATFFVGTEVEKSPAHGMRTLFVVGVQKVDIIHAAAQAHQCKHIYFGANQSFPNDRATSQDWTIWENMIFPLLSQGYWCTLDIDVSCVESLLETGLTERDQFIPMVSVKLPYLQQLGYNATIKLDDRGFAATNPGVWCHSLHDLLKRDAFTSWDRYQNDEVVD